MYAEARWVCSLFQADPVEWAIHWAINYRSVDSAGRLLERSEKRS
jgi:hypothetical protein